MSTAFSIFDFVTSNRYQSEGRVGAKVNRKTKIG